MKINTWKFNSWRIVCNPKDLKVPTDHSNVGCIKLSNSETSLYYKNKHRAVLSKGLLQDSHNPIG